MTALPRLLLLLAFLGAATSTPATLAAAPPAECAAASEVPRGQDCTGVRAVQSGPTSEARFASPLGSGDTPKQAASHGPVTAQRIVSTAEPVSRHAAGAHAQHPAPVYLVTQRLRI